jgi:hypothetical protein
MKRSVQRVASVMDREVHHSPGLAQEVRSAEVSS